MKLYPASFREEYGAELEAQFRDEQREGTLGALGLLFDLAISAPREFVREIGRDLRFSARVYARRPVSTVLAVTALALAIGATTGVFSVINAVLLRSLPFREPERIVGMRMFPNDKTDTPALFHAWRSASAYLDDATTYNSAEMSLYREPEAARVKVTETTWNFFSMLGSDAFRGRAFAPGEDQPGQDSVAVISYSLWQQLFGNDLRVIGSTIRLNGVPLTVVGVARPGFDYPSQSAVWTPTTFDRQKLPKTRVIFWTRVGRIKSNLTFAQAESMMEADAGSLNPESMREKKPDQPVLVSLQRQLAGPVRDASLVLMGGVVLVLLIACANVAHLLLTRLSERRRELAVRAALGASRARLTQQLMVESIVLTSTAALAGLLVARWTARLVATIQPAQLASQVYSILDWRVLGFAMGIALLTGLAFGVFPAWVVSRMQPTEDLARGAGQAGPGAGRLRQVLVAAQVALALVLVAGSITLGRSFNQMLDAPLGFLYKTDHAIALNVSLSGTQPGKSSQRTFEYYREALGRLRSIPSVEAAGAIDALPLATTFFVAAGVTSESGQQARVMYFTVTPDYFRAAGNQMLYGREFNANDKNGTERVAILNEQAARAFGNPRDAIGLKLKFGLKAESTVTVIGVAKTVRGTDPQAAQIFWPLDQSPSCCMTLLARVRGNADDSLAVARDAVRSVDSQVPVFNVRSFENYVEEALARPRFYALTGAFFGGFALLLAILSIYGVATYSIAQRRHEIGIRIAIGATSAGVRKMVLRQSLTPVAVGAALGLLGAAWLGEYAHSLIWTAQKLDPKTCAAAAVLLAIVAAAATWLATRRVTRLDPMEVLRAE
jgi:putative ABC transport system permease protein